ncbi:MAG: phosphoglycerate kinase [Candidatus Falkowbacteria bacterium]
MRIKTITAAHNLAGKKVLVRVDFNVPLKKGKIVESYKITANLPLIKYLIKKEAKVILVSHLGEPVFTTAGKAKERASLSLEPVAKSLAKMLNKKVLFCPQPIGSQDLKKQITGLKDGQVVLLENIRFYEGETKNKKSFAKSLAALGDVYVNNAFAVSHRDHASVSAIKNYLPSYAGTLIEEEVLALAKLMHPQTPFVAVIGGAKIDTKVALIKKLSKKADFVLVGGAVANCFLAARGLKVGKSPATKEQIALAKKIDSRKIIVPIDVIVTDKNFKEITVKKAGQVGAKEYIYDIGPETMKLYARFLRSAKTIFWNGPVGLFEQPRLRQGTLFIGRTIAQHAKGRAYGVVGGGETIEALRMTDMMDYVDWVSTGGGASIAFLSGEKMPGLKGLVK